MYGHDTNAIRSRYDYYYSVSSPSLSQAANYYENQASLFGEPIAPLLPPPIQKSPSPSRIQTPLTPFNNTHNASTSSSAVTNYTTTGVHPPLIENFDNHLLESIRRNILDQQNNNLDVTNALTKHQLWTQNSNSSTNSPPNETSDGGTNFEGRRKRARTAFGNYKSDDDVSQNKYRTLSAHSDMKAFTRLSMETTSDTDNNNGPTRVFFKNNKSNNSTRHETTSNSSSSKLNHSVGLSKIPRMKPTTVKKKEKVPFTMVKSKSDLNSLKTYPDSFTIVTSPKRSPSAGYNPNKRSKSNDDDDDSIMEFEWIKPPPEKLYEAASVIDKYVDDEPPYITEHFGARLSIPTSPIVTNKIMIGSTNRVPPGSFQSHKKIAFAIINDYKNRRTRMLQHRHSEDNMSFSGRFSPYSRYIMQREMSAPSLNRVESLESDDGEFYYFVDDDNEVEPGRQTSIGFVHKKQMSASMSSLNRRRPQSEMRKLGPRYMSTPNFIKINKRAVIQSTPMEKVNPRLILHRSLKGVLKVYNNTNIKTTRRFSLNNMDIFLPNGKIDPNLLAPMPINVEDKRSEKLEKHQVKAQKKRVLVMKRRKLSPIAGTPNKDSKEKEDENKTPKRKMNTPKTRLEERLKKDKFGRLVTPKKAALPNFKATGAKKSTKKTKSDGKEKEDEETAAGTTAKEQEDEKKAMNFLQQIQARNVLGRTIKARIAARQPPPLTRQPSKQSIESLFQDKPPPLKKKSSFSSLKSLSASIRTVTSFKTNKSNSIEDEEAEAGDEITKLQSLKDTKKDGKSKVKSSILAKTKVLGLTSRLTSASSTRSQKEVTVPPPSRTASKTSILSRVSSKLQLDDGKQAQDTPSKKSDVIRVPSATSIMSMTTAAITANPLNTTLTITNQLATQGAEINEKKRAAMEKQSSIDEGVIASHPDADKGSMSSQKTVSSQKTNTSRGGSRKTSAKHSGKNSAEKPRSRASSILGAVVGVNSAIRYLRKQKSKDSIDSVTSDAPQVTSGPGAGADNNDSTPIAGKILEKSQQSLEKVQKTVDKATSEIHHTINENLSNLRKLEKKLSGGNLLEHDANNNDVEKNLSRQSTKQDIAGSSRTTNIAHMSASKMRMDKDGMSVNAISVAPDERSGLQHQSSDESNQTNSSTSSSMDEMSRKRKICCGLSSCCGRTRSESAQMIAGKSSTQPLTMNQKCLNCCCWPFRKMGNPFKRRKVDGMEVMKSKKENSKPSMWERICCCSGCCRRCRKNEDEESMKKKKVAQQKATAGDSEKTSCWSRMNCFKSCKPCCSRMRESCCCSSCCRKKDSSSTDSLQSQGPKIKDNATPGTCTRIFCFCCLCCRKKPEGGEMKEEKKRISMTSQRSMKKGNCCSRMCNAMICCRKKKKPSSRRTSMLSKKQSLAPTIPPPEDLKPKLDMGLVEHASLMKGAIPVLPICLAYFCLICNIIAPGTGTIFSGFFCLCIGIPRFSQHDGARGRIGSFIINSIVGVSQAFTIIFCLVGWGWSIWWGTIMLTLARRHRKIKKAERQKELDEQSGKSSLPGLARGKSRDIEKGIN